MIRGNPDPEDLKKFFRALKPAESAENHLRFGSDDQEVGRARARLR